MGMEDKEKNEFEDAINAIYKEYYFAKWAQSLIRHIKNANDDPSHLTSELSNVLLTKIKKGEVVFSQKSKEKALECAKKCMEIGHYYDAQRWYEIGGYLAKEAAIKAAKGFADEGLSYRGRSLLISCGFHEEAEKL